MTTIGDHDMMAHMSTSHGGIDPWATREAGIDPADIKDFSISINPTSLPESIRDVMADSALYRYPDSQSRALIDALSRKYDIPPKEIIVVNGTSQGIFLLAAARVSPGKKILIAGPTYGEYRDACEAYGAEVIEVSSAEGNDFHPNIDALISEISSTKPAMFWICNPNSPTGAWIDEVERHCLAEACAESECIMVMDEAYARFAPIGLLPAEAHSGVVHLHSMTKDFCVPGLRLGWIQAEASVIEELRRLQPEWSVSSPAQDAGVAFMRHLPYFEESWAKTRGLTKYLSNGIIRLGLRPVPSAGNFVVVRIGTNSDVKNLADKLWAKLIMIRDCESFGLPGYIRIGTRSRDDIDELLSLIAEFRNGGE